MPLYERRDANHEVVEQVRTVAGSRNDQRLAASEGWKVVSEQEEAAPAVVPAPAPVAKRTTAPAPAKEG